VIRFTAGGSSIRAKTVYCGRLERDANKTVLSLGHVPFRSWDEWNHSRMCERSVGRAQPVTGCRFRGSSTWNKVLA
jgi:hypothetical protein